MPKIYKINPLDMTVVHVYDKVSDITTDKHIYRVINGQQYKYTDGFIYRKKTDITINQSDNNLVITYDKYQPVNNENKIYGKYPYTTSLLKTTDYTITQICMMAKQHGESISEPTCRKLKKLINNCNL